MIKTLAVEAPERTAAALLALLGGSIVREVGADRCVFHSTAFRLILTGRSGPTPAEACAIAAATSLSVEEVIERACQIGFHAEEVGAGLMECWLDGAVTLLLETPMGGMKAGARAA